MSDDKKQEGKEPEKAVAVAKITAIQAVVVALITAVAGVAGGYLASQRSSEPTEARTNWIYIEEIRAGFQSRAVENANIRLSFNINGIAYSFPAKALWASLGRHTGAFPLPDADKYAISFSAFVQLEGEVEVSEASSQRITLVDSSSLPFEGVYGLIVRNPDRFVYGGDEELQVVYSVR